MLVFNHNNTICVRLTSLEVLYVGALTKHLDYWNIIDKNTGYVLGSYTSKSNAHHQMEKLYEAAANYESVYRFAKE